MRILIIGSTGNVGRRVVTEAQNRGHDVSVMVRQLDKKNKIKFDGINRLVGDAASADDVERCSQELDIVISAIRPKQGQEHELVQLTRQVMKGALKANVRVLIVGGAARLRVPEQDGQTVLTMPGFLPADVLDIAKACQAQFDMCVTDRGTNWTYISPPAMLMPGERTGTYRQGTDQLVVDDNGVSGISMENFAVALIDEAENGRYIRTAFTVAN